MAFYVTTPIYYVNAEPHLGHAYTTIGADILARHRRQRGEEVFFLTGTDEHGEPVAQAAEQLGIEPKALADRNAARFEALMPQLDVTNDFFIRTSDERHKARVQEVMQRIHDNGHTYKGAYEGWYCPRCADFKTETEIAAGNTCPIHKIPLDRESEENWFFKLSSFQAPLERLYAENPDFIRPRVRFNEAHAFIKGGLQDVSLSRANLTWGVTVPWDPDHVFYVWFDALLNYYTALAFAREGEDLTDRFWPALHMIGKDILKFHAVFWPAMLLAAGIELPEGEFIHGFLLAPPPEDPNAEREKMGKSRGNTIDPFAIIDEHGSDALRFYLFRDVTFGADGEVSLEQFDKRYETELANEYGNLASRTLNMLGRFGDGAVPDAEVDEGVRGDFAGVADEVARQLDAIEISAALETIWLRVRRLNRYVEEQAPWKLAKEPESAAHLRVVLRTLAEGLRVVTVLLHPYMPQRTRTVLAALGDESLDLQRAELGAGDRGQAVARLEPLFPRAAK